jgi:hypothetical protein
MTIQCLASAGITNALPPFSAPSTHISPPLTGNWGQPSAQALFTMLKSISIGEDSLVDLQISLIGSSPLFMNFSCFRIPQSQTGSVSLLFSSVGTGSDMIRSHLPIHFGNSVKIYSPTTYSVTCQFVLPANNFVVDSHTATVTFSPINHSPVISVPASLGLDLDTDVSLGFIQIQDRDVIPVVHDPVICVTLSITPLPTLSLSYDSAPGMIYIQNSGYSVSMFGSLAQVAIALSLVSIQTIAITNQPVGSVFFSNFLCLPFSRFCSFSFFRPNCW